MEWFENLPAHCPPKEAIIPKGEQYYRLSHNPPKDEDFLSLREINPNQSFFVSECIARALSIFPDKDSCLEIKKLPLHKNKLLIALTLNESDGVILRTTSRKGHYSWWRSKEYVINIDKVYME